ncbi:hypothetical protein B0H19DRAFT_1085152 [Mycena capillaripes]|nr:hypothetical protein B0H19DRAFT_1085152 [Mycena capillaripes]
MSLHLGPRLACTARDCDCTTFITGDSDGSPQYMNFLSAETTCAGCSHAWMAHSSDPAGLSATNQRFRKGGAGHGLSSNPCGGFHSIEPVWNMRLPCLCQRKWSAHDRPSSSVNIPVPDEHAAPPVAVPPPSSSSIASQQRPVLAYAGIARPTAATVQRERQASIYRTLPQHQSAGSSTTSPARKKTCLSGPPHSYSATPAASVNDFAEPAAGPALVSITVGILPKVLSNSDYVDSLDHSPAYFWKSGDELEIAQRRLAAANLVFHVQVNESGPIFEVINTGFLAHCLKHKIVFVTPTPVFAAGIVVSTPSTMPWVLTGPKGRPGNRSWVEDPKCLTAFTFTVSALRASPFNNTPNHLSAGILIFIVELTHTDTSSTPIGEYLDLTRPLRSLSSDDSDSDSGFPIPENLNRMIVDGLQPITRSATIAAPSQEPPPNDSKSLPPFVAGPLLLSAMDTASIAVKVHDGTHESALTASSVDCAARALIAYCIWLQSVRQPPVFKFKEVLQEQFSPPDRPWRARSPTLRSCAAGPDFSGPGFGKGPRIQVLTLATKILMSDPQYWTECVWKLCRVSILAQHPGMDPTLISSSRSQQEHDGVYASIISFITLGTVHHVLESLTSSIQWFETPCRELIVTSYDLQIKAVSDVVSQLIFAHANPEDDPWKENDESIALIERMLVEYLTGLGHPDIPDRIVEALGFDREQDDDPLLRARLFMTVMTGSAILPMAPLWSLKVTILHNWDETYPTIVDGVADFGPAAKASFQSCFKTVSITNNTVLRHLMCIPRTSMPGMLSKY